MVRVVAVILSDPIVSLIEARSLPRFVQHLLQRCGVDIGAPISGTLGVTVVVLDVDYCANAPGFSTGGYRIAPAV